MTKNKQSNLIANVKMLNVGFINRNTERRFHYVVNKDDGTVRIGTVGLNFR